MKDKKTSENGNTNRAHRIAVYCRVASERELGESIKDKIKKVDSTPPRSFEDLLNERMRTQFVDKKSRRRKK